MKFCIHYNKNRNFKYLNEVDEIEYIYRSDDIGLIDMLNSLTGNKRIILRITQMLTEEDFKRFKLLEEGYPNLQFAYSLADFKSESSREMYNKLAGAGHATFFHTLVSDWTMLNTMKDIGVSDIYLVEDICFELDKAADVLHRAGIKIRVFPNVCQSSVGIADTAALKTFFIRPEDVVIYEPYVDVMEFFGREDQIKTYYEIYAKNKRWLGTLDEMIIDLNEPVDSRGLSHLFARQRIKCGKKCMKGSKCDICTKLADLSKTLLENDLIFGKEL